MPAIFFFSKRALILALSLLLVLAAGLAGAAPGDLAKTIAELDKARILKNADAALALKPPALTDHIAKLSTGGPHDYYSNGDYWWPDPKKADGLPYIKKDGETNPNNFDFHRLSMRDMKDAVAALGAAYALTGDDKYAAKAAEFIKVFFLDEKTKMNPHLNFAQAIPGVSTGRGIGIIDTLHLAELPYAIDFLQKSPKFPADVTQGVKKWFADYLAWMFSDNKGADEMNAGNNHAVAWLLQAASFAKFTDNQEKLAFCRNRFKTVLMPKQMADNGSFPAELGRTKPYGYSIFQLDNVATLAHVLSTPEDNLWKTDLSGGRTVAKALAFLYPYLADKKKWEADGHTPDVMHYEAWPARQPCLLFGYAALGDAKYFDLWKKLDADPTDLEIRRNMAITQPILWIADPKDAPLLK